MCCSESSSANCYIFISLYFDKGASFSKGKLDFHSWLQRNCARASRHTSQEITRNILLDLFSSGHEKKSLRFRYAWNYRNQAANAAFRREKRKRCYRRRKCVRLHHLHAPRWTFREPWRAPKISHPEASVEMFVRSIVNGNEPTVSIAVSP